jgi:lysozyme family protein
VKITINNNGVIGPLTLAALADADAAKVRRAMEFYAAEYYYLLAKARPANRNFLLGWLNRAYD